MPRGHTSFHEWSVGQVADRIGARATLGLIGLVQYHTGIPAVLVALHVAGAAACTAGTAALWASMRQRTESEPLAR